MSRYILRRLEIDLSKFVIATQRIKDENLLLTLLYMLRILVSFTTQLTGHYAKHMCTCLSGGRLVRGTRSANDFIVQLHE